MSSILRWGAFGVCVASVAATCAATCAAIAAEPMRDNPPAPAAQASPQPTRAQEPGLLRADVVALDQLLVYNRFGSFNPFGMIFALARDVVERGAVEQGGGTGDVDCAARLGTEGVAWAFAPEESGRPIREIAGNARLRDCKRPRPLVLRGAVGDILEIRFTNLLISSRTPGPYDVASPVSNETDKPGFTDTFCKGAAGGRRYGSDPKSPNLEDALWRDQRGADSACASRAEEARDATQGRPRLAAGLPLAKAAKAAASSPGAAHVDADWPSTRHVSLVANGLANAPGPDGSIAPACRGLDAVAPGGTVVCRFRLEAEGSHLLSSVAAPAGGEGDGGSITHGLFAAILVERAGARAYRSQVTAAAFDRVWGKSADASAPPHARVGVKPQDYEAIDAATGRPVLAMHRDLGRRVDVEGRSLPVRELTHGDLNAIVSEWVRDANGATRRESFREFTAILHDELKTFYAANYRELALFGAGQLAGVRDGFAINYGASGMGAMLIANRKGIGPAADCAECLYEEFFLQSWANGDPALLEAFPDDPSNVHHSYLNDRIVFRNFHAGPKETHVFHLHAHQWVAGNDLNRGAYLDSQTIGPQQAFSYRIYQGGTSPYSRDPSKPEGSWTTLGAGNRNRTPGDSIFHCHLYPHFAQGMWALWRNHDVLEDGTRRLPDGQKEPGLSLTPRPLAPAGGRLPARAGVDLATGASGEGTPIPAIIPLPDADVPAPLLPTYGADGMPGYPFYIPGQPGRRAPQAPLDLAQDVENGVAVTRDGGLPRHVVESGVREFSAARPDAPTPTNAQEQVAQASETLARSLALADFSTHWKKATLKTLPLDGADLEKRAMAFHYDGRALWGASAPRLVTADGAAARYDAAKSGYVSPGQLNAFKVNGAAPRPGAPFADPCALPDGAAGAPVWRTSDGAPATRALGAVDDAFTKGLPFWAGVAGASGLERFVADPGFIGFRRYSVSAVQTRLSVNRAGWHDPQARINVLSNEAFAVKTGEGAAAKKSPEPFFFRATSGECVEFRHTNETPHVLERDDFQVATPTDTIGQHIHLVKFDVMAADGSANGWNYEDGTFAPDEIHHRLCAWKAADPNAIGSGALQGKLYGRGCEGELAPLWTSNAQAGPSRAWFQTTVQRWFADPLLSTTGRKEPGADVAEMRDRTLRTVFTHDHFGPSSIQQHGFYSALVIEPQRHMVCGDETKDGVTVPCAVARGYDPANVASLSSGYDPRLIENDAAMVGARKLVMADADEVLQRAAKWRAAGAAPDADEATRSAFLRSLNLREYALAIADFALLYDPNAEGGEAQIAKGPRKGLACIAHEAEAKAKGAAPLALSKICGGGVEVANEAELRKSGDAPPAAFARLTQDDARALRAAAVALREREGRPIAPPRRPESISVDHHDPYLVNYRNAPLALRVGADAARTKTGEEFATSGPCAMFHPPGRTGPKRDVDTQVEGEVGDMANAFLTLAPVERDAAGALRRVLHAQPCTPLLESYSGERVQVRLIQGAQEVQHSFTVEGQSFPRNVDERLPRAPIAPANAAPSAAPSTRHARCVAADGALPLAPIGDIARGVDLPAKDMLRAACDNIDARMTAREVGISEHFEFESPFLSEGNSAESPLRSLRSPQTRLQDKKKTTRAAQAELEASPTGDTLYHFGSQDALWNGAWGFLRVHDGVRAAEGKDHTLCLGRLSASSASGPRFYAMEQGCAAPGDARARLGARLAPLPEPAIRAMQVRAVGAEREKTSQALDVVARLLPQPRPSAFRSGAGARSMRDIVRPPLLNAPIATVSCPVVGETARVRVTAKAHRHRYHRDAKLIDVYGLALAGEAESSPGGAPVTVSGGDGESPLVVRMNAGDCLEMTIVNALPKDDPKRRFGAPRMPDIVSLNVDRGGPDTPSGSYAIDAHGDNLAARALRRSNRLALTIPAPTTMNRRDFGAPFGLNPTGALWPAGSGKPNVERVTFYAGTMGADWAALDARLEKSGVCGAAKGWTRKPDVDTTPARVDILGRSYYADPAPPAAGLEACLRQHAQDALDPRPYAFGPLPIKSYGDAISHLPHGLAGVLVVEAQGARHLGATGFGTARFELPAVSAPSPSPDQPPIMLPSAFLSDHALLWQDGLSMRGDHLWSRALWPVADCHVCDDSYDFGKRGVSYRADHLAARLRVSGGRTPSSQTKDVAVNGLFDWNRTSLPARLFQPSFAPLALAPLTSQAGDDVAIRVVHPGGRARQRAFALGGAGYDDLAPDFGFPNAALLAPGKAITAHLRAVARDGDCQLWRDGPNYMVGQGVWGLHRVGQGGPCGATTMGATPKGATK